MALIEHTLFGKVDKVKTAIERIQNFNPLELGQDQPYYVAYSGGKDSDVIRILCQLANVPHELWHNHTTVDAPETVRYVRSIPDIHINYPEYQGERITMWKLIVKKKIPPTRIQRYCCEVLKERGGEGRFVVTGVRWAESAKRRSRALAEIQANKKGNGIYLHNDNDEARRMMETCELKGQRVINPIIDWTDADVWEFLNYYGCQSNPLYQCGYHRVGCVGCPMSTRQAQVLERYPKYAESYIRAFQRMIDRYDYANLSENWKTGQEVFDWWVSGKAMPRELEGQIGMEDQYES
jgi:phosphoadenosine phosphosulfate reductase